jgi:hypothetical protein
VICSQTEAFYRMPMMLPQIVIIHFSKCDQYDQY